MKLLDGVAPVWEIVRIAGDFSTLIILTLFIA